MTLEQLRIFVAVAETLHVTRAAQALHLTQSAASAAIAALETRYDVRLFDRIGRHIELTAAGRAFLPEARAVLERAADAELALREVVGLKRGAIGLFASQTIAGYWLPPILRRFRASYPDIAISLTIGNTAEGVAAVRDGSVELGFVEGATDDVMLDRQELAGDRLILVVAADHPWALDGLLGIDALVDSPWVLRESGSGTRQVFATALADAGLNIARLPIAMELPSNEAVRGAVEAGAGATVISDLVVAAAIQAGSLKHIAFPDKFPSLDRRFAVIRHRDRHRSRISEALLSLINADS